MLPRVQRIRRGDRVLCYHRPTKTRLPDLPEDHPDFIAAWAAAEAAMKGAPEPPKSGTLSSIIGHLTTSARWRELSPAYRSIMLRHMDPINTAYGGAPIRGIRQKHIQADLAKLDANPAGHRLKTWRLIMSHARSAGQIGEDPSIGIAKPATKSGGHATWTAGEVATYRNRWMVGTPQRAAFELLCWTGARVSDAARLTKSNIGRDGVMSFRQAKTGGIAYVPWTCPLPGWAAAWNVERETMRTAVMQIAGFTLLQTAYGKGRSVKGLSNLISDAARDAGIHGRSAHGLRKYRLTMIAESGGSAHAIMSWGGHASLSEAEHYTRAASRKALIMGAEQEQNAVNAPRDGCKRQIL